MHRSLNLLLISSALLLSAAGQEAKDNPAFPKLDVSKLPIARKIHIGGDPDWLAVGFSSIWISVPRENQIVRVNPRKNTAAARINLGKDQEPCYGIGIGPNRVWVLNCKSQVLARINPFTDKVDLRIPVTIDPSGEGGIAVDSRSVWFVNNEDGHSSTLIQADASSGRTLRKVSVGRESAVVKRGFGSIWVVSSGEGKVYRIDPREGRVVAQIGVSAGARFATIGGGAVWVLSQSDGAVSRIDPATNTVTAVIQAQIPGSGGEICYGGGLVWATMNGTPVVRIDPARNQVVDEYGNYQRADAIRYGFGSTWVSDHGKGDLWRIQLPNLAGRSNGQMHNQPSTPEH